MKHLVDVDYLEVNLHNMRVKSKTKTVEVESGLGQHEAELKAIEQVKGGLKGRVYRFRAYYRGVMSNE